MTVAVRSLGGAYVPRMGYDRAGANDINGTYEDATLVNPVFDGRPANFPGWPINVQAFPYLAAGDGVTDDTEAIQAAIEAAEPTYGTVYVPNGNYLLRGTGDQLLLVSRSINILGESWGGVNLVVHQSVPSTTDVIRLHPAVGVAFQQFTIENLFIVPASGTPARHGLVVDTTDAGIAYATFRNIRINAIGGRAVYTVNPTLSDGFYTSTFENCYFSGGCKLQRAGDSIVFRQNTITGANIGIEADFVVGATQFDILENNITSTSSAIKIGLAGLVVIRENNIEATAGAAYPGVPVIDLAGDVAQPMTPQIMGNSISALVADGDAIYMDYAYGAYVGPNTIYIAGTGTGVSIGSHAFVQPPTVDLKGIRWSGSSTTKLTDVSQTAIIPQGAQRMALAYSASMTPDALSGRTQSITATDGNAFTINAPTNAYIGLRLAIIIRNPSGGALGTATWNAVYKMTAWTQPATGFSQTIEFEYNGTNWIEQSRTAADVPN